MTFFIAQNLEDSISLLKQSVSEFESFKYEDEKSEVSLGEAQNELFKNEFFNHKHSKSVLDPDFKHYDLKNNAFNEKFL
jgi:hypothetical protein